MFRSERAIRSSVFVMMTVLLLHGLPALIKGPLVSSDTGTYSQWGDRLLAERSYAWVPGDRLAGAGALFYTGFISVVAVAKLITADWGWLILGLNVLASAGTALLVVRATLLVTRNVAAGWVALGLYVVSFEFFNWSRYVLSDTTFTFLTFGTFYFLVATSIREKTRHRALGTGIVLLFGTFLYRPVGPVYALSVTLGLLLLSPGLEGFRTRRRPRIFVLAAVASVVIGMAAAIPRIAAALPSVDRILGVYLARFSSGVVVAARPETFHQPPETLPEYGWLAADRLLHFFYFWLDGFSLAHNVANSVFFIPAYGLIAAGLVIAHRAAMELFSAREKSTVVVSAMTVGLLAGFHALTYLDFDWRYRLPLLPHVVFLAAIGADRVVRWFRSHSKPPLSSSDPPHTSMVRPR